MRVKGIEKDKGGHQKKFPGKWEGGHEVRSPIRGGNVLVLDAILVNDWNVEGW